MELSQKVDTDNILEKLSMGSIVLGAGLSLAHIHTFLILFGTTLYFANMALLGCLAKHNRRKADHVPRKRKILS